MTCPRILIAGIGNIFFGDDAFGVEVFRRIAQQTLPDGVCAIDFGIRGFDLACAILAGYDAVILVDATVRGGPAGTLYVIEPNLEFLESDETAPELEGHALNPTRVLQLVQAMGGRTPTLRLVGCEPASLGCEDEPQLGLSPAVADAVERALPLIRSLIDEFAIGGDGRHARG